MNLFTKTLNNVIDGINTEYGGKVDVWLRAHHRTGVIYAWRVQIKDAQVQCFAVMEDGSVHHDRHENLVALFQSGDQSVGIGNKKKFGGKF